MHKNFRDKQPGIPWEGAVIRRSMFALAVLVFGIVGCAKAAASKHPELTPVPLPAEYFTGSTGQLTFHSAVNYLWKLNVRFSPGRYAWVSYGSEIQRNQASPGGSRTKLSGFSCDGTNCSIPIAVLVSPRDTRVKVAISWETETGQAAENQIEFVVLPDGLPGDLPVSK